MAEPVRVQALTERYLHGALSISNKFVGAGRKRLCCLIPLSLLPTPMSEFKKLYATEDSLSASAVAVRESDDKVVGFVQMTDASMKRDPFGKCLHPSCEGECYIEMMSVLPEMRGQGIGTRLLQFCETWARERGAHKLTLGVVARNPAKHLYERFGFVECESNTASACCNSLCVFFLLGFPHWGCGATMMAKNLLS
ncbi:hypothetical protein GUITHDRAFT_153512 [Guillardia theta CCMP2712]|uniref:N-acetyltransferase domain-containing protein n=1 Tax=Guillardia theta (strain CCMP2712) TaxID=905079 RepID=L1J2C5_GUITC|nr:hypothetical protein GUITHDRAFT_153512 [Guillardia theta CCMP2712]EKX42676.1 hypothetical protein GUITHDRAFT_153512 [Guillardia theta CCMP2712]|eukprot:XP_005829656.1 hypothetical protein GUITHDRAFT_153512 [Guillardia theta CCMP2712]